MPPLLQLHLLVVLFATTAIFGRLASVSAPVLVSWRTLIAALAALAWVAFARRQPLWPGARQAAKLLGIGAIVGAHWLAFFGSIKISNISICLAGMATTSLFTAFTEPLFERRRIRPFEVLLGLLVLAGIIVIAGVERTHLAGLGLALVAAFLAAVFPVLNRRLVTRGGDPLLMVGWEMIGAFLACMIALPLFEASSFQALLSPLPADWIWILFLALVCTVFSHAWHIHLLRSLSAYTGNLAINFEPVWGILAAAIFFGEGAELHPAFYLGTLAIIAANLLHPLLQRRAIRPRIPHG